MHLEAHPVAEAVEEPILEDFAGLLRELRWETMLVEELADEPVELGAEIWVGSFRRPVERSHRPVVANELLGASPMQKARVMSA